MSDAPTETTAHTSPRPASLNRCPGPGVTELFDTETRPLPPEIVEDSWHDLGTEAIAADRYTSPEFFAAEKARMWPNVWQMAAREDELPEIGDVVLYENVGRSYVLIRQDDGSIRAFHNVCLHRGRKLRTESGHIDELKCPFHGFTWDRDGAFNSAPCAWDFSHLDKRDMALPEVRVGLFAGFVFITESADAAPLEVYLEPLPRLFKRWRLEECYTAIWVGKVIKANWKVCAEAFMEAWHSVTTHPEILPFTGDANTRYSIWGDHANLALTPFGVLSPHLAGKPGYGEHTILNAMGLDSGRTVGSAGAALGDQQTARSLLAEMNRARYLTDIGWDGDDATDSEMLDAYTFNAFPNVSPWGGFAPNVVYRWRPWPDQDSTLMEVRLLVRQPKGEPRPRAVPMTFLEEDQPWSSYTAWGMLGNVFDQDMGNLPFVQGGLKASANNRVELGNYQESRIRQFQQTLDKYLDETLPKKA